MKMQALSFKQLLIKYPMNTKITSSINSSNSNSANN